MKNIKFISVLIIVAMIYTGFIFLDHREQTHGESPVISVSDKVLEVSVKDKDKKLLKGVKASDKEDGNITSRVFIENISEFDENKERTITYAVFDNDDHITRATRKIKYNDYKAPTFDIAFPLVTRYFGNRSYYLQHVKAKSSVDGDISSKLNFKVINPDITSPYDLIEYQVTDSTGTTSTIRLKANDIIGDGKVEINLYDNLIYVDKGTNIHPMAYVEEVKYLDMEDQELYRNIKVQTDYNPDKAGTYEFIYHVTAPNGDYGVSKLVVVVK